MKPYKHALIAEKLHNRAWQEFINIHTFMDETKAHFAGHAHRALLHNEWGVYLGEYLYSPELGDLARIEAENHCLEDIGFIPKLSWWLDKLPHSSFEKNIRRMPAYSDWRDNPAKAAVKKYGGAEKDFDQAFAFMELPRVMTDTKRADLFVKNSWGIFLAERCLGPVIKTSDGAAIPTRLILEDIVIARWACIPSLQDIWENLDISQTVMGRDAGKGIKQIKTGIRIAS